MYLFANYIYYVDIDYSVHAVSDNEYFVELETKLSTGLILVHKTYIALQLKY